jgi:phage tail-like protein
MAREAPYGNFKFNVIEETGAIVGGFSDVSGLNAEVTVAEYRTGADKQNHVIKVPGVHKFENVTLKRGIIDSKSFWDWMKEVWTQGPAAKRVIRVVMQSESDQDVQQWKLSGAFPVKYTGPTLAAAGGTEVAMEEWQIAYDVMEFSQLGIPE